MKKSVGILLVLFLLVSFVSVSFVYAVEDDDYDTGAIANDGNEKVDLKDVGKNIGEKTNAFVDKEVKLPENLEKITRFIFKVPEGEAINLSSLIILVAVFLMLWMILGSILKLVPFFETNFKSIFGGLVVTLIIAVSGGIMFGAHMFMQLGTLFGVLEKYHFLSLVLSIVIVIIIIIIAKTVGKIIKTSQDIEQASHGGAQAGAAASYLTKFWDLFRS